jgi:four helix bundle protein
MGDYRKLRAWQLGRDLAVRSKPLIKKLPPEERDALSDQWRRASYSVVLNIAEGASRRGPREFRRYLDVARASLHEIATIIDLVEGLEYLTASELAPIRALRDECARTVFGLLRSMTRPPP